VFCRLRQTFLFQLHAVVKANVRIILFLLICQCCFIELFKQIELNYNCQILKQNQLYAVFL